MTAQIAKPAKTQADVVAEVVEAAHARGFDAIVANMPNGDVRVFVDAASAEYKQKRTTILPVKYKRFGTEYKGVWAMKKITGQALKDALAKAAEGDKETRIRLVKKENGYYWKTGKLVTMTKGKYQTLIMRLRREAGWKPLHHHPHTRPKTSTALKQNAKQGYAPNKKIYLEKGEK